MILRIFSNLKVKDLAEKYKKIADKYKKIADKCFRIVSKMKKVSLGMTFCLALKFYGEKTGLMQNSIFFKL